jgi:hypothetical protein
MYAWERQGITLSEEEPSGVAEAALDALRRRLPGIAESPTATRYGIMCAERPAVWSVGDVPKPVVWNRRVWVITIPAQWIPGGPRGATRRSTEPFPMNYVFDGETGEYIFGFGP